MNYKANSGATNGTKKSAVKPMAVKGSGVSNQPPPSACHTRKPDSGYARQNAVIGRRAKKTTPARLGLRGARMEPVRNPSPNRPTPAKVSQRRNQPGSWSPKGKPPCPKSRQREKSEQKTERRREPTQHSFWYWPHLRLTGPERLATTRFSRRYYCRHRCALPSSWTMANVVYRLVAGS